MLSNAEIETRVWQILHEADIYPRNVQVENVGVIRVVVPTDLFGLSARNKLHHFEHANMCPAQGLPTEFNYTFAQFNLTQRFVYYTFFWREA